MRYLSILLTLILAVTTAEARTTKLNPAKGCTFKVTDGTLIELVDNSVTVKAEGKQAAVRFEGSWDLSKTKALKFSIRNESSDAAMTVFSSVANPGCKANGRSNEPAKGKAQHQTLLKPGETKEVWFYLPAPMPHPEVNQIFYDNWVIQRSRNTPYSYGYGLYCYDVDLKDINAITIGVFKAEAGTAFTVTDVELVGGRQNEVPVWMVRNTEEFFPFIDRYGQFKYADWPGKVLNDNDLQKAREEEEQDLAANPGPEDWTKYGGWKDGPRQEATGHFRVQKIDGKWWLVDPEGYLFWSHGVVRVTPSCAVTPLDGHEFYFEDLPDDSADPLYQFRFTYDELLRPYYTERGIRETYDFSCANISRKYGDNYRQKWYDLAHRRLRSWGLNTIANSSDRTICLMDKTVYNDRVDLGSPVEGYPEWPVLEGSTGWWKFIDPYDKLFETCVRAHIETKIQELEDPWCLGLFVDNEIKWGDETYLGSLALKASPAQASKKLLVAALMWKYSSIEELNKSWHSDYKGWDELSDRQTYVPKGADPDLASFSKMMVREYFSTVRRVFKEIAPQKLYMGCRFSSAPEFVVRIGAEYCDIMSYNPYLYGMEKFRFPEGVDVPMMVGEFHFGAMDRGMFHPGQVYCDSQEERGECYEAYLVSCLQNPLIVGTNWHQFSDQSTTGRFDGENFQVGLTDVCDTPYPETIRHLRFIGDSLYRLRSAH